MEEKTLFDQDTELSAPLASRVRPKDFSDFIGQTHLVGPGKFLREMIDKDQISSMILWGPPGVGKTTLAEIIAHKTKSEFVTFSAVMNGIMEIRKIMDEAEENRRYGIRTIVFIDEIHRFNKAQQDAFLPYVEKGSIILIGATTENPSFEINSALLSRTRVFVLKQLTKTDIIQLLKKVLHSPASFHGLEVHINETALKQIAVFSNGDARTALNTLEMLVINSEIKDHKTSISKDLIDILLDKKTAYYDKNGEEHYNIISALHKSMRNSDVDSAVYWLGRMIDGGEDPVYIARRLVRFASEDIGLADNTALNLAVNTFQACRYLGLPECDVHLTQCVIYLSVTPKSNAVYKARIASEKDIRQTMDEPVPLHLRNAATKLMKEEGYGKGYQLAHFYEDKMTTMPTRPEHIADHIYYVPTDQGNEGNVKKRLEYIRQWKKTHDTHFKKEYPAYNKNPIYIYFPEFTEEREVIMTIQYLKLEIFIPATHFRILQKALQSVDAGHIGNYDSCLSYSPVKGTWRPLEGTTPYIGKKNEISEEEEYKVEVTIKKENLEKTMAAVKEIHPYEEPVINVIPLYAAGI